MLHPHPNHVHNRPPFPHVARLVHTLNTRPEYNPLGPVEKAEAQNVAQALDGVERLRTYCLTSWVATFDHDGTHYRLTVGGDGVVTCLEC